MRAATVPDAGDVTPDARSSTASFNADSSASLLLLANRLPVTIEMPEDGIRFVPSVGGVATSMAAVMRDFECTRIGAANIASAQLSLQQREHFISELRIRQRTHALFLSQSELDGHYWGFSNSVLWPWLHGLARHSPWPQWWWNAYVAVNRRFAEAAVQHMVGEPLVWVNDFHLCLVPAFLRELGVRTRVGFFLHVPVPEYHESAAPVFFSDLMQGLLGADLIGVYTQRDKINLTAWIAACGETEGGLFQRRSPPPAVEAFALGIDPAHLDRLSRSRRTRRFAAKLRSALNGVTVLLSVDRLDLTKGLIDKLNAFDELLSHNPSLLCEVQLIMVVAPSRMELPAHVALACTIAAKVDIINNRHGTLHWRPVHYIDRTLDQADLVAYYAIADVAVVTPIADGMNLVSKEYLFTRRANGGRLILTTTAGASSELREAYLVTPGDVPAIAAAMLAAIKAASPITKHNTNVMVNRLTTQTVRKWTQDFIGALRDEVG